MRRRSLHTRGDGGAAAVEFTFIFVFLFLPICFGTLSAGVVFSDKLALSQGVREAARYGATLPYTSAGRDAYLTTIRTAAVDAGAPGQLGSGSPAYCVAFRESSGANRDWHLATGSSTAVNTACPGTAGPSRSHVLVTATKPGVFDFVLSKMTFTISSESVARYEGATP